MPQAQIPDELWHEFNAQQARFGFPNPAEFLKFCLSIAETRYWPAVGAIVTRDDREILMVGNDYGGDELVWNLPGGAVDPGEDLVQAVIRELHEETSITALEVGSLAWIVQGNRKNNRPFIIGFAFEITTWEGQVSVDNEVEHGDVQQAKFVPFDQALACMIPGNRAAFGDWLAGPAELPRIYLTSPNGTRRVK
jgi:ADP-ribose pyrophosphatase YjhB (NUDIX family)